MSDLFSVEFIYHNQSYSALAYFKELQGKPMFRVTVMNGDLEKLLFGHQLFYIHDGEVDSSSNAVDVEIGTLRKALAEALNKYIPTPVRA